MTSLRTLHVFRAASRLSAAVLGATFVLLGAGCYAERLPPPAYRYACDADNDCHDPEQCIESLCQIPCSLATFEEACPEEGGFLTCLNGTCSTGCELGGTTCPSGLECFDVGLGDVGGGFFSGTNEQLGVCARPCGEATCPTGEVCVAAVGLCAPTCSDVLACPQILECVNGLCLPPLSGSSGDASDGTDSSESSSESTATTNMDGSTTTGTPGDEMTSASTIDPDTAGTGVTQ